MPIKPVMTYTIFCDICGFVAGCDCSHGYGTASDARTGHGDCCYTTLGPAADPVKIVCDYKCRGKVVCICCNVRWSRDEDGVLLSPADDCQADYNTYRMCKSCHDNISGCRDCSRVPVQLTKE